MQRWGFLLVAALFGCGLSRPEVAPRQSEAMERSARLLAALDRVEADLHSQDAVMNAYAELVYRHGQAQQIACNVSKEHVDEIHRLAQAQERKQLQKHKKRRIAMQAGSGRALASR